MHTRYDNVLGTSQAHPDEHAPIRMRLDGDQDQLAASRAMIGRTYIVITA